MNSGCRISGFPAVAILMISFGVNRSMRPFDSQVKRLGSLRDTGNEKDFRDQVGRRNPKGLIFGIDGILRIYYSFKSLV